MTPGHPIPTETPQPEMSRLKSDAPRATYSVQKRAGTWLAGPSVGKWPHWLSFSPLGAWRPSTYVLEVMKGSCLEGSDLTSHPT